MLSNEEISRYGDIGKVISFFQEIDKIPRKSGNESGIVDYLKNFAKDRKDLDFYSDEFNNVIIKKKSTNGTNGYLAFQSHTDMICEKIDTSNHDFSADPIQLIIDGDYIRSLDTSIGADNGIGVAYMLAMLDSHTIQHPNLEMIFTSEEETSMNGAKNINFSNIKSKRIISLDAFSDDVINCGCASNFSRVLKFNSVRHTIPETDTKSSYQISIDGFERWTFRKRY